MHPLTPPQHTCRLSNTATMRRANLATFMSCGVLAAARALIQVEPTSGQYVDVSDGRVRIFHGLNAVYKLAPWIPSSPGFDPLYSLGPSDMALLRSWGFNVLRVGFEWDGLLTPSGWNTTLLNSLRTLVDTLGTYGIYTIADMHQDSLSRHYCGYVA